MPAVRENKLGLVAFTREFWPQSPCTTDFVSLKWVMDRWVGLGSAPGGGCRLRRRIARCHRNNQGRSRQSSAGKRRHPHERRRLDEKTAWVWPRRWKI